jgi:hypothetical protein
VHFLLHSRDPEADRGFFQDVLGFPAVDVGHGWLIFGMPPAEAAIHPMDASTKPLARNAMLDAVLYLMCDDLSTVITMLQSKNVICTKIQETNWGGLTTIPLPSGGSVGLYQPKHATALHLNSK